MTHRQFIIRFSLIVALPLLLIIVFNFTMDPLQYYRKTPFNPAYFSNLQRFQGPGLARNYDYDRVILGTSMSENFVPSYVDDQLGGKTLNLSISGSSAKEQNLIANVVMNKDKATNVIWEVNIDSIIDSHTAVREQYGAFPYYLYDKNPLSKINYLLSRDTTGLSADILLYQLGRKEIAIRDLETLNNWHASSTYGKEALKKIWGPGRFTPFDAQHHENMVKNNIAFNYVQVAKDNPNVNICFYFPPFSILKYRSYYNANPLKFENMLLAIEYLVESVTSLNNVVVYSFQHESAITFNLDNYKDYSHYSQEINEFIIDAIKSGQYIVTVDNIQQYKNQLRDQVESLDTATLW